LVEIDRWQDINGISDNPWKDKVDEFLVFWASNLLTRETIYIRLTRFWFRS